MSRRQYYAIIPAAGRSRRMGQSKLLLPWPHRSNRKWTVIDQVLSAWTSSDVNSTIVVVRKGDEALRAICENWPVSIVQPKRDPIDMKESLQIGFDRLASEWTDASTTHCFVAPADSPALTSRIINAIIHARNGDDRIVVPRFGNRNGHPTLIPWGLMNEISHLAPDQGVNAIVDRHAKQYVELPAVDFVGDIDTPEDYERLFSASERKLSS
ncbi:MAG: nucleotidyltransferase family protein [Planctomycetales bacterium]|nr:nucleotidyltransferase family protein [Planctomycetales bacterium]